MEAKKRNVIALIINSIIVISTFIIMINGVAKGASSGQVGENMFGLGYFKPYTIDTNVLNGIVSLMMVSFNIYNLIENKDELPRFLVVGQLISTVGVTVTLLTVIFFLSLMQYINNGGFIWLFRDDMFFFHFLNPILSIINFVYIDRKYHLSNKEIFIGMLTTILYSFVYVYYVLIEKSWSDFYGFTFGGKLYMGLISIFIMYLVTFLISYLLVKLNAKSKKR